MKDENQALYQGITLARYYLNIKNPSVEEIGQAVWLHEELNKATQVAVQNGTAKAFSK